MPGVKVKKGDTVQVLSGKDRGKRGKVVRVWPREDRVLVEGVNTVVRHEPIRMQRGRAGQSGGRTQKDMPVRLSTVGVVCSSCDRPSRIGQEADETGAKRRICRRCGGTV